MVDVLSTFVVRLGAAPGKLRVTSSGLNNSKREHQEYFLFTVLGYHGKAPTGSFSINTALSSISLVIPTIRTSGLRMYFKSLDRTTPYAIHLQLLRLLHIFGRALANWIECGSTAPECLVPIG
jgi:hypothetical protein